MNAADEHPSANAASLVDNPSPRHEAKDLAVPLAERVERLHQQPPFGDRFCGVGSRAFVHQPAYSIIQVAAADLAPALVRHCVPGDPVQPRERLSGDLVQPAPKR